MMSTAVDRTYAYAPPRYPTHLVASARLPGGTNIVIRPIHPEDDAIERAFIRSLSRDSAYNRLLSARKLTPEVIRHLTRIDYEQEMAFIAVTVNGGEARLLGVASDPGSGSLRAVRRGSAADTVLIGQLPGNQQRADGHGCQH